MGKPFRKLKYNMENRYLEKLASLPFFVKPSLILGAGAGVGATIGTHGYNLLHRKDPSKKVNAAKVGLGTGAAVAGLTALGLGGGALILKNSLKESLKKMHPEWYANKV